MKTSWGMVCLLATVLLTGCATNKPDWNARIGTYTYDDAVVDLGPPDKEQKLTDGALVAEWLTERGRPAYVGGVGGAGYYGGGMGWRGYSPGYVPGAPDYFIRLTFAPDGKLASWKKFAR